MTGQKRNILNHLLQLWPHGTVAVASWLKSMGAYQQLMHEYEKSGWVRRIGRGAFARGGDEVDPGRKDFRQAYKGEFAGMSPIHVDYAELVQVRERIISETGVRLRLLRLLRLFQAMDEYSGGILTLSGRGRNAGYPAPPAQIPACGTTALGSCLK